MAQKKGRAKIDSLIFQIKNYTPVCKQPCIRDSVNVKNFSALASEFSAANLDTALLLTRQALALAEKINWAIGRAQCNYSVGRILSSKGDYLLALDSYSKSLRIWDSLEKKAGRELIPEIKYRKSTVLMGTGVVYVMKGDYTTATTVFYQTLKIGEELNNKSVLAACNGNIGLVFRRLGNTEKALEYYLKAFKMNEAVKDKNGMAINLSNIGTVYSIRHELINALDYFQQSLKLYREIDNKIGIARITGNIGTVYDDQGDAYILKGDSLLAKDSYHKAINYYKQALVIQEEIGDKVNMTINLGNIGSVLIDLKNYNEGEKYLQRSLAMAEEINSLDDIATGNENLREFYGTTGDYKKAFEYYAKEVAAKDSLFNRDKVEENTSKEVNYKNEKKEAVAKAEYDKAIAVANADKLRSIAEADKKRILAELNKNLALAEADKKFLEAEVEKKFAINEADNKRLLAESDRERIKLEAEKKVAASESENERQKLVRNMVALGAGIILLSSFFIFLFYKRKKDADHRQKELTLGLQVAETEMKALRSQMNPHFIFNALQSIQAFLANRRSDDANTYLIKFADLMRLVLENSRETKVCLKNELEALELYMQLESIRLTYPFTYRLVVAKELDIENEKIPPLIFQPFIENAIWHGLRYKSEPGKIEISLKKKDGMLKTSITDNGVGRSHAGTLGKPIITSHEPLGIRLTQERLDLLNKTDKTKAGFEITDLYNELNQPAGTKVEILLPLET